ncbi:MAG: ABC transporter permease [Sphaerochaetaceae bacterium]|nr:ABC transporter permease [Sphaerochaetaceae bacterium]
METKLRLAGNRNAAEIAQIQREIYGLDKPVIQRYFTWIARIIFRGDFGISVLNQRSVMDLIRSRLPTTLLITSLSIIVTWIVAIPIGILSAVRKYTLFDYTTTFFAFFGMAVPNFLLALLLMLFVHNSFGWDIGGLVSQEYIDAPLSIGKVMDAARHLIIPVIVIALSATAGLVRILRSMVLDEMGKLYVLTARAKGLSERVVIGKHILKIAMIPVVTTIGWLLPELISGETIIAIVMNLPTVGQLFLKSLQAQDSFVSGALILILSTLTIIGSLISDILLAVIDRRVVYT